MRTLARAIAVSVGGLGLLAGTTDGRAQSLGTPPPAIDLPYAPPIVFDNALDEKILAAQAQMLPMHRLRHAMHRHPLRARH
jgi:hypothetical protein